MRRKSKRSNAGLFISLAFCLVFGTAFGYFVGGCSSVNQDTSSNASHPSPHRTNASTPQGNVDDDNKTTPLPPVDGTGEISCVESGKQRVALTFDAGASAEPASSILQTLAHHNLHATFFLTGEWCEQNPELVKRIADAGHEIGNHTYSHKDLLNLDDQEIAEELEKMAILVRKLTGRNPAALARPPFGSRDTRVLAKMRADGYVPIYWSVDSWDSFKAGITSLEIEKRVLKHIKDGGIVLMHCGSKPTADALGSIISTLAKRGYSMVTVSELISE